MSTAWSFCDQTDQALLEARHRSNLYTEFIMCVLILILAWLWCRRASGGSTLTMMLGVVSALALMSPCAARDLMQTAAATPVEADSQAQRLKLATHTIGVNSAFMEVRHAIHKLIIILTATYVSSVAP